MVAVADLLTIVRFGIGLVLIPAVWSMELGYTAWLVSIAWLTDVADGRLARAGGGEGRMGQWDITADMVVSASLLIGLAGSGKVPVIFATGALVVLGGWPSPEIRPQPSGAVWSWSTSPTSSTGCRR